MKPSFFCVLGLAVLCCTSCGNTNGLYPVSGQVTCKGQPAVGATVLFQRQGADPLQEPTRMGVVQPDGSFSIDSGQLGKGAAVGDYAVRIVWRQDPALPRDGGRKSHWPDRLKGRYADREHPLLWAEVKPRNNHLPPFELTESDE
jgi:hypothetical protein